MGLKQNILNANKKEGGDDDEVNTGEPAAAEEDVKEDGQEGKSPGDANESDTKLVGAISQDEDMTRDETQPAPQPKKQEYPLMDMLCSFLYEDEEPLPILCGYFSKIVE